MIAMQSLLSVPLMSLYQLGQKLPGQSADTATPHCRSLSCHNFASQHSDEPFKRLERLLTPGVSRRHRRRLPAPVRLHRLKRSSTTSYPDGQAHAPRVSLPRPAALAILSTRRLNCDIDSPNTRSSSLHVSESCRRPFRATRVSGVTTKYAPFPAWSVFDRSMFTSPAPPSTSSTSRHRRATASEMRRPASDMTDARAILSRPRLHREVSPASG